MASMFQLCYTACSSALETAISMSCALSWLSGWASMRARSSAGMRAVRARMHAGEGRQQDVREALL